MTHHAHRPLSGAPAAPWLVACVVLSFWAAACGSSGGDPGGNPDLASDTSAPDDAGEETGVGEPDAGADTTPPPDADAVDVGGDGPAERPADGAADRTGDVIGDRGMDGGPADRDATVDRATPPDVGTPVSQKNQCIVPLGDSITQGDVGHLTYRYWLWQKMVAANLSPSFVGTQRGGYNGVPAYPDLAFDQNHEGHWGRRADEILAGLPGYLTGYIPGIVLLHAGTNDCRMAQPETETIAELGQMIDILRQRNSAVVILVATILPLLDVPGNNSVKAYNSLLPALVAARNTAASPVVLVDQNLGVVPATDLYDGIHPNEASEKRLADRWLAALQPFLAGAEPCRY